MPRQHKHTLWPPSGKTFLGLLGVVYVVYLVVFGNFVYSWMTGQSGSSNAISEHVVDSSSNSVVNYWTTSMMGNAVDADQLIDNSSASNDVNATQASSDPNAGKAALQDGQAPTDGSVDYPLSTVGKIFFTN